MTNLYHFFRPAKNGRSFFAWIVALAFLLNLLVSANLWARPDKKNGVTTASANNVTSVILLNKGFAQLDCVTPTFGSITYDPSELYYGEPSSLTSTITGLIPNVSQTFTYTIDGNVQPLVTVTSDADGKIINPLSALDNVSASLLSVGTHIVAITKITIDQCSLDLTTNNSVTLTVKPGRGTPDLTPVVHASPSSQYGVTPFTVVVDVFNLSALPTNGKIKVFVNKTMKVSLNLPAATSVGGLPVQNSDWNLNEFEDPDYYILTSNAVISAGDMLSFGLNGVLTPGSTSGRVSVIAVIIPLSGGEGLVNATNNTDSDRINYFAQ